MPPEEKTTTQDVVSGVSNKQKMRPPDVFNLMLRGRERANKQIVIKDCFSREEFSLIALNVVRHILQKPDSAVGILH